MEKKYAFTHQNKTFQTFVKDLFINGLFTVFIIPSVLVGYLRVVEYGGEYFYWFLQVIHLLKRSFRYLSQFYSTSFIPTWLRPSLMNSSLLQIVMSVQA